MAPVVTAEATRAGPTGATISGNWIRLAPLSSYPASAIDDLRFRFGLRPEMVAPGAHGTPAGSRFGDAVVIADARSGEMLGFLSNVELAEYPGVAGLVIYVDELRARGGYAMEAWYRYVERIFQLGALKVQMEVLSFNTPVHRIMRKIGARPEVVLREHFYIGGRFWDGTLYGFDRQAWETVARRYRHVIDKPSALARANAAEVRLSPTEEVSMKVDYLILADAATASEGRHYLHGAGWESLTTRGFPAFHPRMSAALRVRIPGTDPTHRVGVDLVDSDGASLLSAPTFAELTPAPAAPFPQADDQLFCLAFNFEGLHFTAPGAYSVVVTVDGLEVHRARFQVRELVES